jgi:hypothetical protein
MPSIITAGTTTGTALNLTGDTSGELQIKTNNGSTTALTLTTGGAATFTAGSVSAPAITTTGDTNTGIFFPAADTIAFTEGGAESMRIDSSGNVGIGTSSPTNFGSNFKMLAVQGSDYGVIQAISNSGSTTLEMMGSSGIGYVGTRTNHPVAFRTNDTERMRITDAGKILIGTTTSIVKLTVVDTDPVVATFKSDSASGAGYYIDNSGRASGKKFGILVGNVANGALSIKDETAGADRLVIDSSGNLLVGTTTAGANALLACNSGSNYWQYGASTTGSSIFWVLTSGGTGVSLTAGNTSWAAQSDERTKDIIEPIGNALNKVDSLRAVIGKYKTDEEGTRRSFLIAQDVQAVLPEVIDTDTDEQGTMSIRYTEVIPLLVAAIKELKAEIDLLKGK